MKNGESDLPGKAPQVGHPKWFIGDEKSWGLHPRVFVGKGRAMSDGSPALLKTRQNLWREEAEKLWRSLVANGWLRSEPLLGANAVH